jgi:uncharacterized repeat protein (TIGR03837 family)
MNNHTTSCAIFCRVIDNFGDAGVSWRLARQLATDYGWAVCLYIDDLARLSPLLDANDHDLRRVSIRSWDAASDVTEAAHIVIETFACELPAQYVALMARSPCPPVWINLEYLSAEAWVDGCHGLTSRTAQGALTKHFFFPGFTSISGGLLRENDYEARRDAFDRDAFLTEISLTPRPHERLISYFAYPSAALPALLDQLANSDRPSTVILPGSAAPCIARGMVRTWPIPFLTQRHYDRLLWLCELNFVRGEDSFVRAQYAGKPFFWHIYPQDDEAHWAKLHAFLDRYLAHQTPELAHAVRTLWTQWNSASAPSWSTLESAWPSWNALAHAWQHERLTAEDLAQRLVRFCSG